MINLMETKRKISEREVDNILNPANWEVSEPKERMFTSDHVVDAYFKGKTAGLEEAEQLILKNLQENIESAGNLTSEVLNLLRTDFGFNPISARLKINSWSNFKILIVLPRAEFLNPKIFDLYDKLTDIENNSEKEFFKVSYSVFGASADEINDSCLISDGYKLKHKQ